MNKKIKYLLIAPFSLLLLAACTDENITQEKDTDKVEQVSETTENNYKEDLIHKVAKNITDIQDTKGYFLNKADINYNYENSEIKIKMNGIFDKNNLEESKLTIELNTKEYNSNLLSAESIDLKNETIEVTFKGNEMIFTNKDNGVLKTSDIEQLIPLFITENENQDSFLKQNVTINSKEYVIDNVKDKFWSDILTIINDYGFFLHYGESTYLALTVINDYHNEKGDENVTLVREKDNLLTYQYVTNYEDNNYNKESITIEFDEDKLTYFNLKYYDSDNVDEVIVDESLTIKEIE